jgi:CTP:molybdopterin cytidylyltransferase MocA
VSERGVAALILAAGASTRLGSPKQLAKLGPETLLERAVRTAREAGCRPILVVLGASADKIQAACALGDAEILINENWTEGMGLSLRVGVERLAARAAAIVVMTCDQPTVSGDHLTRLIQRSQQLQSPVCSSYPGGRGVPACFPASSFSELTRLGGNTGARRLLASAPAVELIDGDLDVDTAESLREAQRRIR